MICDGKAGVALRGLRVGCHGMAPTMRTLKIDDPGGLTVGSRGVFFVGRGVAERGNRLIDDHARDEVSVCWKQVDT